MAVGYETIESKLTLKKTYLLEKVGHLIPPGLESSHSLLFLLLQTVGHLIPPGVDSSHSLLCLLSQPSQDVGHMVAKFGEEEADGEEGDDHQCFKF
jgi:hypothetical protein